MDLVTLALARKGRTATVVVAASDASSRSRSGADYVCDGVDDQEEIQQAIDAVRGTGGRVVLSEGTFRVNAIPGPTLGPVTTAAAIRLPSNVTLEGQGLGTVVRLEDNQDTAIRSVSVIVNDNFFVGGNTNIAVRNLTVDGNKAGQDLANIPNPQDWECINFKYVTNSVVEGCRCINAVGDGIDIDDGERNVVSSNICENNEGAGIHISIGSPRNLISGNITRGNGAGLQRAGIDVYNSSPDNVVTGNLSEGDYRGIATRSACVIDGNVIIGHTAPDGSINGAIAIESSGGSGSVVSNNRIQGGVRAISGSFGLGDVVVSGNVCIGQTATALSFFDSTGGGHVVEANIVKDAGGNGMTIGGPLNTISGNSIASSGARGIWLAETAHHSVVSGNVVSGSGHRGIEIQANSVLCSSNRVRDSTSNGIHVSGDTCLITANLVTGSGGDNISDTGTGNTVDGNKTG